MNRSNVFSPYRQGRSRYLSEHIITTFCHHLFRPTKRNIVHGELERIQLIDSPSLGLGQSRLLIVDGDVKLVPSWLFTFSNATFLRKSNHLDPAKEVEYNMRLSLTRDSSSWRRGCHMTPDYSALI